jgi:hypothetical protein
MIFGRRLHARFSMHARFYKKRKKGIKVGFLRI